MVDVGIEAMNVFGGSVYLDVMQLAKHRQLDTTRFENLRKPRLFLEEIRDFHRLYRWGL